MFSKFNAKKGTDSEQGETISRKVTDTSKNFRFAAKNANFSFFFFGMHLKRVIINPACPPAAPGLKKKKFGGGGTV